MNITSIHGGKHLQSIPMVLYRSGRITIVLDFKGNGRDEKDIVKGIYGDGTELNLNNLFVKWSRR